MPHFTVVPVDGPRRGDYDNLEGLSWVDYEERGEREDPDGEGAPPTGPRRGGVRPREATLSPTRRTSGRTQNLEPPDPGPAAPALGLAVCPRAAAPSGRASLFPAPAPPLRAAGVGCRRGHPNLGSRRATLHPKSESPFPLLLPVNQSQTRFSESPAGSLLSISWQGRPGACQRDPVSDDAS